MKKTTAWKGIISLVMLVLIILSIGFLRKVDPDNTGGGVW